MHEAEAARQGIPLVYRPLDPTAIHRTMSDWSGVVEQADDFGYRGFNITHPAKKTVVPALDELDDDAALFGTVNTITVSDGRLIGRNTDHCGFSKALTSIGVDPSAGDVIQIDAGGAGSAIAYALLKAGVPKLSIADIDSASAEVLITRLSAVFDRSRMRSISPADLAETAGGAVGLVNSTPVGMTGVSDGSPFPPESLHPDLWVGDAIYRPLPTILAQAAAELGCPSFGGAAWLSGRLLRRSGCSPVSAPTTTQCSRHSHRWLP